MSGSKISIISGTFAREYFDTIITDSELLPASFITVNGVAMYSNRISHFFNFQEAGMRIDTGCSASMVALHQAVQNLQLRESDIPQAPRAVLNPDIFIVMSLH